MKLKDIFEISQGTRKLLAITISVTLSAIVFAYFYYRGMNRSEDPRIMEAKELLLEYEKMTRGISGIESFYILDSAFAIFSSIPDYDGSYEKGVIYNNKCSGLMLNALYDNDTIRGEKSHLLAMAMEFCDSSIFIYKKWLDEWEGLSSEQIATKLEPKMNANDPAFNGFNFGRIFKRRVKNIVDAQYETPRRLSVSLTNKGTIFRHLNEPDSALVYVRMALSLWEDNRTAESNLSVLMGGEPLKPNLIESLFPPERKKN
jgi:hypothetical protein